MKKIAVLLLLLVACQFVGPVRRAPTPPPPEIFTGTSALEITFSSASTSELIMCQQSDVYVDLKNTGAFDIQNGEYGFIVEEQYLKPLSPKKGRFSLEGKSQYLPHGGLDQILLKLSNKGLPEQLEKYSSNVVFQACYPYQTSAAVPVCIDPDVQNLNPQKPCRAEITTLSGGQGAPVEVVSVEPRMVPVGDKVKPTFKIFMRNGGIGQVISPAGIGKACGAGAAESRELASYVDVKVEMQGRALTCGPDLRLEVGSDSWIICESSEVYGVAQGTFNTILVITLDYGYVSTKVFSLSITRLPQQDKC